VLVCVSCTVVTFGFPQGWQLTQTVRAPVPCLASSSRLWLVAKRRGMTGNEAMLLQGWEQGDLVQPADKPFAESTLMSLAGNAMNGFVLSNLFLALFVSIDIDDMRAAHDARCRPMFGGIVEQFSKIVTKDTDDGEKQLEEACTDAVKEPEFEEALPDTEIETALEEAFADIVDIE
jgi:hypothetical protein